MVIKRKISREKITTQQRLMARMGNGLLRQIKDSAEAERIKRETGDEDMFVFYETRKEKRPRTEWTSWAEPQARPNTSQPRKPGSLLEYFPPTEQDPAQGSMRTMEYDPWRVARKFLLAPGFTGGSSQPADKKRIVESPSRPERLIQLLNNAPATGTPAQGQPVAGQSAGNKAPGPLTGPPSPATLPPP